MIIKTNFETILPIWKNQLWPTRTSKIETHSAMLLSGEYELKNYRYPPSFFILMVDGVVVGCNSGHKCCDGTYRSRGLYVFPEHRKKGYGKDLLVATIRQGLSEDATHIWSYPRLESWPTYESARFKLISDWKTDETGMNAYCVYDGWRSGL